MSDQPSNFSGTIPQHYEALLGPVIFADYALDLAQRVASLHPAQVLELAAGTGILTRAMRDLLPEAGLVVTDLNPPMLEVARPKFGLDERIEFQQADATMLPFADASFDAVACQFGVMFFSDKERAFREAFRVLHPGGWLIFNVWDSLAHNPFARLTQTFVEGLFPKDPPRFYRTPFGYFRIDPVKEVLEAAGFSDLSMVVLKRRKRVADVAAFARGLIMGNAVSEEIRLRGGVDLEQVVATLAGRLLAEFGHDPAEMPLQSIAFQARKPGSG